MLKINQAAKLAGVSVRTLQYYDKIALLKPAKLTDSGYREYDNENLARLEEIMFFRELDFPLADIKAILDSQGYNRNQALEKQKHLLDMKITRLNGLVELINNHLKGENTMSFGKFDTQEIKKQIEEYKIEAKERWGNTAEFKEYENEHSSDNQDNKIDGMNAIIKEFSCCLSLKPENTRVQALVKKWQDFISTNYYQCSDEILYSLSLMYTEDQRFKDNMDSFGEGTAELISNAIKYYCQNK